MLTKTRMNWSVSFYEAFQLRNNSSREIVTHASHLNQGEGGRISFYNKSAKLKSKSDKSPFESDLPSKQIKYCLQFVVTIKIILLCNMSFTFSVQSLHGSSIGGNRKIEKHCVFAIPKDNDFEFVHITIFRTGSFWTPYTSAIDL